MKKILVAILLGTLLMLTGCRGNAGADAEELLKSVPATASFVAVADLDALLQKSGCKVKDGEISASKELLQAVNASSDLEFRHLMSLFLDNKSGVDPSVTLFFTDGYNTYNTGLLRDTKLFCQAVETEAKGQFTETDGIKVLKNIAVKDNRYWALLRGRAEADPTEIKRYLSLSETQSFVSSRFAESLKAIKTDVEGWGDLKGLMNLADLPFQRQAAIKIALSTCFKDAGYTTFTLDFRKGEMDARLNLLNDKGENAKFNFELGQVDPATLAGLGGKCGILFGIAVPQKLIKQLKEQLSSKPSMLGIYLMALSELDGTVGVAASENKDDLHAVLTTTGQNSSDLMSLLESYGKVSKQGNRIFIEKGSVTGALDVAAASNDFKGAAAGIVTGPMPQTAGVAKTSILLKPEGKGVVLNVKATGADSSRNILLEMLAGTAKK